ncbi:Serpin B6 [Bulinus truncatus]|nr:Serpin B6 [Bulinus truncatus]
MATCGTATVTCILLLVFMAALYGSTYAKEADEQTDDSLSVMDQQTILTRYRRSRKGPIASSGPPFINKRRGSQGRIDDTTNDDDDSNVSGRRSGGRKKKGKGGNKPARGPKRSSGGKMPLGVNRKSLAFAEKIGSASSQFASKLLKAVYPKIQSNIIISPLSIHAALSMVLLGARKSTEKELISSLGLKQAGVKKAQIHKGYQALLASLTNVHDNVVLNITNAVFAKPNIPIEAAFREGLTQMYGAKFDSFKFDDPAGPEAPINNWVAGATKNKIKDLLSPGTITPLTSLVLVNAIFFNASWDKPFSSSLTSLKPFNSLSEGVKNVETMAITNYFSYVDNAGAEVIELPFRGDRMAMYVIQPSNLSSVDQIVEELSNTQRFGQSAADQIFRNMEPTSISLEMPKFKIEIDALKLKDPLQSLGIRNAFTDKADFSGISAVDLAVDDVIHKAVIDVNERGTEASAATAVLMARRWAFDFFFITQIFFFA